MATTTRRGLRRTTSVSKVEHVTRDEKRARISMPDQPVHKNTDSLFSTSSGFTNYRGLLNLALILLVLSNTRLFLENLMKYGVLIEPLETIKKCFGNLNNWPNVKILLWQSLHPTFALMLEYGLSKARIPEAVGVLGHVVNGLVQLTYPAYIVLKEHPSPVFSSMTLAVATVLFLKLISYAHTNYWCRKHKRDRSVTTQRNRRQSHSGDHNGSVDDRNGMTQLPQPPLVKYPDNLNVKDMAYFVLAPTLCYELNFPRSARIRKRFLIKRILEMVFLMMVIIGLVQQWIVPTINNAIKPLSELDFFRCMERLLKLAVPNHLIWLMFFYAFFHSMLNVLAELLMFGDRDFYQDWWNADTISEFWQNWNVPVHRWCIRHLYKPVRRRGLGKMPSSVAVFFVSAFFHEYLLSVPLKMFKVWAFTGMLMQVPLAYVTGKYMSGKWGNIVVWLSLILGQPVAILAYVHDYYVTTVVNQPVN
ncbi:diacylglycerol O-acyltransferase 1-like isoform X2 [Littorina saxatilis]|uniref:O-acyltransferase n=1 Tax=Littorina saxatilis TaxID=31220 RepID=A0AAN9GML7_9CAEN